MIDKEPESNSRQADPRPARKMIGRILARLLIFSLAAVVILLVAAYLALQTAPARRMVRGVIEKAAARQLDAKLQIGDISGSLLFDVSFHKVRISRSGQEILTAKRISVDYLPSMLFSRILALGEIQIDGMVLDLERGKDGRWNLENLLKDTTPADSGGSSFTTLLRGVSIRNAAVTIKDDRTGALITRHIRDLRLQAGLNLSSREEVTAKISELAFTLDTPAFTLAGLDGRIGYDFREKRLGLKDVHIRTGESDLTLNGSLGLSPASEFDLRAALKSLSLPEISRVFKVPIPKKPQTLTGTLYAKGTPNRFYQETDLKLGPMSLAGRGDVALSQAGALDADISAVIQHLNPAALPLAGAKELAGDITTAIRLKGTGLNRSDRRGQVTIDLKPSQLKNFRLSGAKIAAAFDSDKISVKESYLAGPPGHIAIHRAEIDLPDNTRPARLSLDAAIRDLSPSAAGRSDISGKLNFDLQAQASLPPAKSLRFTPSAVSASAAVLLQPSVIQGIAIGSGRFKGDWNGKDLRIQTLALASPVIHLTTSGSITPDSRKARLKFDLSFADLKQAAPLAARLVPQLLSASGQPVPVKGRLDVTGSLNGAWDRPEIEAVVSGSNFRYEQFAASGFRVKGSFAGVPENFTATAVAHLDNLSARGTELRRLDLNLRLVPDHLLADVKLEHAEGFDVAASGRLDNWRGPSRKIRLDSFRFSASRPGSAAAPWPLTNKGPIRLTVTGRGIDIAALKLLSKEAGISVTGHLGADGALDAKIRVDRLDLNRIPGLQAQKGGIAGVLAADATLTGTPADPVLQGRFHIAKASGFDFSFSDLEGSLDYRKSRAVVKAAGYRRKDKIIDLSGETGARLALVPFDFALLPGSFALTVKAQSVKLSSLPLPKQPGYDFDGILTLAATAGGDLSDPHLSGTLSLKDGYFAPANQSRFSFSDLNLAFQYRQAQASVKGTLSRPHQKDFTIDGGAGLKLSLLPFQFSPLDNDFRLSLMAPGIRLSSLPIPRKPGLDFDGVLNLEAEASGGLLNPVISGKLSLAAGSLKLSDPALSYEDVTARIAFAPGRIEIEKLTLKGKREGTLNLNGRIDTAGLKPVGFDIRLTGEKIDIPYKKAISTRIRPDLHLTGTPAAPRLTGKIAILEGRVNIDKLTAQGPAEIEIVSRPPEKEVTIGLEEKKSAWQALIDPLAADVTVQVPRDAWLKGQGLNVEIGGEVNLKKEATKPFILIGSLKTIRGTYEFMGKLFTIAQGSVEFVGLEKPDPSLDIQAENDIADVKIIVKIGGTASKLTLALDSQPTMDRSDIISYLVFGRPTDKLDQQQSFNAEQAALNLTGSLAAKELKKLLGDVFQLDVFTLESQGGDIAQGSLAVGKYVTPKVFVLYRHRFKVDDPDQLEFSYEINRNFSVQTQLGDEKSSGIDFVWDFDF